MKPSGFYRASESEQIRRLQGLASSALERWSLSDAEIRPVAYRENMTFAVDAGRRGRFALRVHQAGYRTDAQVQSELDFMERLAAFGVKTPEVVRADGGESFVVVGDAAVPERRQCDLFEWIDGRPVRKVAEPVEWSEEEAERTYREIGRLSAAVFDASESWSQPAGFERPRWDEAGIFGVDGNLGDFRELTGASPEQLKLLEAIAERANAELASFGKDADRYGLCQADLLPENVLVCADGLRLIDFDDAGESWVLLEAITSVWDLKLLDSPCYEPCLKGFIDGFRERRPLPDEHLALLPTFLFARLLSYLAHTVSRNHLESAPVLQQVLLAFFEKEGRDYVRC